MIWAAEQQLQDGKYVIESVLGQGGFGITYKARHTRLNADVVIKTPNEHLRYDPDYSKYIDRFIKEGQLLERLSQKQHPHIVRVRDLFDEGDIPCMVMDFVPGKNLFQLVRERGALPEQEILPCIRQIAAALSMMHQEGLVHRDAHPGNIIVQGDGKAILIDFGIAKELIPSTQSTTGSAGNHGFAPYEQMTGSSSRQPNVDVYCLAATLYYAATGERPATAFDRKLYGVALKAPKQIKPSISDSLNQAILQGMALEAGDRPQSMQAWLEQFNPPASVSPTPPRPVRQAPARPAPSKARASSSPKAVPRKPSRTIPWLSLAVVLLGYAVAGGIFSLSSASVWFLAGVSAFALALAWTWARARARAGVLALALALAGTWAGVVLALALAGTWAGAGAGTGVSALALALTWAWALAGAEAKLSDSFTPFQTGLILSGVSVGGLGLGWLVVAGLRSIGVALPSFPLQ